MSPRMDELQNRLAKAAKSAADDAGLRPDTGAQDYLGNLVRRAAEELGPEAGPAEVARAEAAFRRLAISVSAQRRTGSAGGQDQEGDLSQRQVSVSAIHIESALAGLCPGFFPFC